MLAFTNSKAKCTTCTSKRYKWQVAFRLHSCGICCCVGWPLFIEVVN